MLDDDIISEQDESLLDIFDHGKKEDPWMGSFTPMTKDQLLPEFEAEIKAKLTGIPPLPNIYCQLITALNDVKMSSKEISKLASQDPVLVGKILQLVNSSYFGVSEEVKSVDTAIVLLGFNNIKNFVLQNNVSKVLKGVDESIFPLEDFWLHSLAVSVSAYHIANGIPELDSGDNSTIALLHDLGKIAMAIHEPAKFKNYIDAIEANPLMPSIIIEEEIFGINHALLGSLLTESWKLPEVICKTIMYHHHPPFVPSDRIPEGCKKSVIVVHFADLICKMSDMTIESKDIQAINDEYFHLIGKKPPLELLLDNETAAEIQKVKVFMK